MNLSTLKSNHFWIARENYLRNEARAHTLVQISRFDTEKEAYYDRPV